MIPIKLSHQLATASGHPPMARWRADRRYQMIVASATASNLGDFPDDLREDIERSLAAAVASGHPGVRSVDWNEADHPRGPDGKFGKGSGALGKAFDRPRALEISDLPERAEGYRKKSLNGVTKVWSYFNDQDKKNFRKAVNDKVEGDTYIRVNLDALIKIAADGKIRTIHDVGGKGDDYSKERVDYERAIMEQPPGSGGPVYGYRGDVNDARGYGQFAIKIKPEVDDRTTATIGDSLTGGLQPYPISRFRDGLTDEQLIASTRDVEAMSLQFGRFNTYMEAQIHGGVTLDDIDTITLDQVSLSSIPDDTKEAFARKGIRLIEQG